MALAIALESAEKKEPRQDDEALVILERIAKEVPNVEIGGARLGDLVESALFERKNLAVGRVPPEIVGQDAEGATFRLSEYRGRVVVLDFWVDWCPFCVAMYPFERELVRKYAGQPFVLLGVNCDEPERLQRVLAARTVTWRSWADGPRGPIAQDWHVDSFPTVYVLDHEGVIRYKNVRGDELAKAVAELVAKVPGATAAKTLPPETTPKVPAVDKPADKPEPDLRTWTSRDGRKAEMRFMGLDGDKVRFRRTDGSEVEIPLDRLSDEDQQRIRAHAEQK